MSGSSQPLMLKCTHRLSIRCSIHAETTWPSTSEADIKCSPSCVALQHGGFKQAELGCLSTVGHVEWCHTRTLAAQSRFVPVNDLARGDVALLLRYLITHCKCIALLCSNIIQIYFIIFVTITSRFGCIMLLSCVLPCLQLGACMHAFPCWYRQCSF